eukprot:CAMPEP_0183517754 /NCGR_PEP_ID=MMETSP0371-20130417/15081_1 /TAXON_ID=268820 /ORGANISM="Peridinium aciculiferum, Strain PAER-2" /LENGTH=30 /DNA_ID= /DNA_START= /DNA_END= /DNA_ORIENTATION=
MMLTWPMDTRDARPGLLKLGTYGNLGGTYK